MPETLTQMTKRYELSQVGAVFPSEPGHKTLEAFALRMALELAINRDESGKSNQPQRKMVVVNGGEPISGKTRFRRILREILTNFSDINLKDLRDRRTRSETVLWENHGLFRAMSKDPGAIPGIEHLTSANGYLAVALRQAFWRSNVVFLEAPLITAAPIGEGWVGELRGSEIVKQLVKREGEIFADFPDFDLWLNWMVGGRDLRMSMAYYRELMKQARTLKEMQQAAARYGKSPNSMGRPYPVSLPQGKKEQRQGATLIQTRNIEGIVNKVIGHVNETGGLNLPPNVSLDPTGSTRPLAVARLMSYFNQEIGISPDRTFIGFNNPSLEELGVDPLVVEEDKMRLERSPR